MNGCGRRGLGLLCWAGVLAGEAMAAEAIWQGLNYNLGSAETNISAGANWSTGTVPGPGDSVRFLHYGYVGTMGDLRIGDADTAFNPDGDFVFLANYGGETWRQESDILVDKSLTLNSLKVACDGSSSGRAQARLRLDTVDNDGATLTLTGDGEALNLLDAGWDAISTYGDIRFTGDSITFSDSARGGSILGVAQNSYPCTMVFDNPTGAVYLGKRAGATLGLAHMGLAVRSGQTWTAHPDAYVYLARNGARSILDSLGGDRLDNLGEVDFRIGHEQYGEHSYLTLPGGTYGSLYGTGQGSRTFQVTLQGDAVFADRFPGSTHALRIGKGTMGAAGFDVSTLDGDLYFSDTGSITGTNSTFTVDGSIRNRGPGGINGNAATVVALTGDMDNQGASTTGSGLYLSTVNAIGGGPEQVFEVGDNQLLALPATASYSIGTLNVGFGATPARVKLVNDYLNNNPVVASDDTDRVGEKLLVGTLNVNAGSTLDVNGQTVGVGPLTVASDAWLDLNLGIPLEDGQVVSNFVGQGSQAAAWSTFADRVKDSSHPSFSFEAWQNTPLLSTPVGGTSQLAFDGVNDYFDMSGDGLGTGTISAFTVELWLRVASSPGAWGYAIHRGKAKDVGSSIYWLGVHGTDNLSYGAAANGKITLGDTGVPIDANWHHLALTYDGSVQSVYLDGVLKTNGTIGAISNQRTSNKFSVGSTSWDAVYRPVGGNIAEVRVWNYARSAAEILAAKDTQAAGTESGLVGYWPADEGYGTTLDDASANSSTATLRNGLTWDGGETTTYWRAVGPAGATLLLVR